PRHAHQVVSTMYREQIKPATARGMPVRIACEQLDPEHRHQLRKLYHGPVLGTISEHVRVYQPDEGKHVRYTILAWKELFRAMFHPERSSEDLTDAELHEVILQVQAFAAMELGVEFPDEEVR
ncbi:MAG TPA: hypothetical protein VD932_05435, partial [Aquabacterium sp.]|nr:hypothetical protein [Aquabacterium sp.]